ncbi:hypothetical protein CASFOL_002620 [Castilleja foliolosa]|uniref:Uncharacterized protein n=1 Tax=Castilleja foliolosa TaxID=1961234 RepID=A0ABD3EIR9_9LAMI
MGKSLNNIFFLLFAASILLHSNNCFQLNVTNNISNTIIQYNVIKNTSNLDAIKLFDNEIGDEFAAQVMSNATTFAWQVLNQTDYASEEKYIPKVISLYLSDFAGYGLENYETIKISAWYINSTYHTLGNTSKLLFTSLMYHEITHIVQWKPNEAPYGLIEGIADYVMRKSGYYQEEWYKKVGSGKTWDEGYEITEMFLEYCDSLKNGFTAQLNKKMRYSYSDDYFEELLGKNVSQLWKDYKAIHGNINDTSDQATNIRLIAGLNY